MTRTDESGNRVKVFTDVLGREVKFQRLDSQGNVYSTSLVEYDSLDRQPP